MRLVAVALLIPFLAPQEVAWKTDVKAALKEAAGARKLTLIAFHTKTRKACERFQKETLANADVITALGRYVCVKVDPEGTDDENRLWQELEQPMPPVMIVLDPEGKQLAKLTALNPKYLVPQMGQIPGAYFDKVVPARAKLATDPAHIESLVALGEAFMVFNQPKESAKRYSEAVASLTSKGDNAGALKVLTRQLDRYYEEKWYQAARECCAKIAELDPKNETKARPRAAWVSGMGAIQDRRFDDAILELKGAVDAYKDCGFVEQIMFSLGAAYKEKKDYDNALVWWDTIVIKHPDTETAKTAETVAAKLREDMQKGK